MAKNKRRIATLVARRVREMRAAKKWTQVRLSADAGVARATIATIEAGHDVPSLDTITAIARAFGVPLAALMLDPARRLRDAVALAVLSADEAAVRAVAAQLDIDSPESR